MSWVLRSEEHLCVMEERVVMVRCADKGKDCVFEEGQLRLLYLCFLEEFNRNVKDKEKYTIR